MEQRERWRKALDALTSKHAERRPKFVTESGLAVEPLYEPDVSFDPADRLGYPGQFPFTRGVQPNMYRGKFWTMRQYAGFGTAEESNARYRYLLSQGTTGLSVAFDLPTQIGYDSDSAEAAGEVGRVGVAVSSIEDMQVLFHDIPLEKVSTSMTINATAPVLMALYIAVARSRGIAESDLEGTVQNDILKEFIARGTYIYPPTQSLRLVTDVIDYCRVNLPKWNTISISGYHIREAGSTAVQELAFTFSNAAAYVRAAQARGLDIDAFAPRLAFFWGCHNNFLEEIAKFRASRRIWAKLMRDRLGAKSERSWMLRFHTQTAGCTLTAQQPDNNAVRVTLQALAAVLGGTQSLHTNALDEALGLPTERTAQVALRTQQIIAYESGVADTVDPLGGSYYVEELTNRIEAEVWQEIDHVEQLGGSVAAIEKHYFQDAIAREAYRYQKEVEDLDRVIVGVNKFHVAEKGEPPVLHVDPSLEEKQRANLAKLRRERDATKVATSLTQLRAAAQGTENMMPVLIAAVEHKATLGEISNCLREAWGVYTDV
ncbi:MAG: methylmalonyl-CoA mutase [bacterium]|nr:methylmalonyl-CoA mutase [bacterium]MBK8130523.1 methylmalonyl-CoA mutase [bacterium]